MLQEKIILTPVITKNYLTITGNEMINNLPLNKYTYQQVRDIICSQDISSNMITYFTFDRALIKLNEVVRNISDPVLITAVEDLIIQVRIMCNAFLYVEHHYGHDREILLGLLLEGEHKPNTEVEVRVSDGKIDNRTLTNLRSTISQEDYHPPTFDVYMDLIIHDAGLAHHIVESNTWYVSLHLRQAILLQYIASPEGETV